MTMTAAEAQAEIQEIRDARARKGGRMSNQERDRIAELESVISPQPLEEKPMSDETPQGTKRIMIMHHNAGMPSPGGAIKVYRFDIVETTAAHAEALCNAVSSSGDPMAKETSDPVTVIIQDGKRVEVAEEAEEVEE